MKTVTPKEIVKIVVCTVAILVVGSILVCISVVWPVDWDS